MLRRKIIWWALCVAELLIILFCCVWLLCETVKDLKMPLGGNDVDSAFKPIYLSSGKVLRVAVLDDSFAWPAMRRSRFDKKCVVTSDDGEKYVRIVSASCNSIVVDSMRRIVEQGHVQDVEECLEILSSETQTMVVISFYLMANVYFFFVVMVLFLFVWIYNRVKLVLGRGRVRYAEQNSAELNE